MVLRISGDELDPEDISTLLNAVATESYAKGDEDQNAVEVLSIFYVR